MLKPNYIPKIIHYCWFGRKNKSYLAIRCIKSWEKFCPDFEIKEWNEDNFDLCCNRYVREAYISKKWAFVTDYARLKILYDFGGIYMDTDVEVVKPLAEFLKLPAFSGFEDMDKIPTGIIGSVKKNRWIEELLKDYDDRAFIKPDGSYDLTTNVQLITEKTKLMYQINLDNSMIVLPDLSLYPFDWFCPKSLETRKITLTDNTHTVHHFSGSWLSFSQKLKIHLTHILGKSGMKMLSKIKKFIYRFDGKKQRNI